MARPLCTAWLRLRASNTHPPPVILRCAARPTTSGSVTYVPDEGVKRAAVAVVLRPRGSVDDPSGTDILLIRRAEREGDQWSGQLALPGGRWQKGETDLETAVRETKEEVGLDLAGSGFRYGGRISDREVNAGGKPMVVSVFVFMQTSLENIGPIALQESEVAEAFWVDVEALEVACRAQEITRHEEAVAPGAPRPCLSELKFTASRMVSMMFAGRKRRRKHDKGRNDAAAATRTHSVAAKTTRATKATITQTTKKQSPSPSPSSSSSTLMFDLAERLLPRRALEYMGSTAVYFPAIYLVPPPRNGGGELRQVEYPLWGITLGIVSDLVAEARGTGLVRTAGYRLGSKTLDFVFRRCLNCLSFAQTWCTVMGMDGRLALRCLVCFAFSFGVWLCIAPAQGTPPS